MLSTTKQRMSSADAMLGCLANLGRIQTALDSFGMRLPEASMQAGKKICAATLATVLLQRWSGQSSPDIQMPEQCATCLGLCGSFPAESACLRQTVSQQTSLAMTITNQQCLSCHHEAFALTQRWLLQNPLQLFCLSAGP